MARQIDGIDRAASRYRQTATLRQITRNEISTNETPLQTHTREAPDRTQVIGIPLLIQPTPPWRRQPWDEPQTRPITGDITIRTELA